MIRSRTKSRNEQHTIFKRTRILSILALMAVVAYIISNISILTIEQSNFGATTSSLKKTGDACIDEPMRGPGVPTFQARIELGSILETEKMQFGAELGVQQGSFSKKTLLSWKSCREYLLVDIWAPQENYKDIANYDQTKQDTFYRTTLENTKPWEDKIKVCRNFTTVCATTVPDGSLDYVYVDARHDFKCVLDDVRTWWPKLRSGGIMAGHDYATQDDGPQQSGQDWTINYDGTIDKTRTVVKGAVDKFAAEVCRQVTVGYREKGFNTWAMRK